jgi:hypothetical protein
MDALGALQLGPFSGRLLAVSPATPPMSVMNSRRFN